MRTVLCMCLISLAIVHGAPVPDDVEEVIEKKIISPVTPAPKPKTSDDEIQPEPADKLYPTLNPSADVTSTPKNGSSPFDMVSLDGFLSLLKMFKGVLPTEITNTLDDLTQTDKNEVLALFADWYHGNLKRPENKEELAKMIKEKLPSVHEKVDRLNTTFYEKFNRLKPETRDFLRTWKDKSLELHGTNAVDSARKQIQLFRDFATTLREMNDDMKQDLRAQFPTAISILDSSGFAIVTSLILLVQKLVEAFGPTAAPVVQCPIPLD